VQDALEVDVTGQDVAIVARVVIAHDFMETYGGAERVTQEMAQAFPDAPVFTILGRPSVAARMGIEDRFHSLLPPRPRLLRDYRLLTPLFPALIEKARLPEADVLLTSSYAFAHGLRTRNDAPQVCYCHSPLRFAWTMTESYRREWTGNPVSGKAFSGLAAAMRAIDRRNSRRPTSYVTQSRYTAAQIARSYGRQAEVIGVPIDGEVFQLSRNGPSDYFLLCGRLVEPYKRAALAIEAFRSLPQKLVIAGDGPALPALRAVAPKNVEFVGHLEDRDLVEVMQGCVAGLFPSRDDFGLVPLEIMACGRPVLAYADGGAPQTVVPGMSGELFPEQSPAAIVQAVERFQPEAYEPARIREHAMNWSRDRFRRNLTEVVERVAR
jgi:glycosyltransferase involved in cell wall biosynthesis